MADEGQSLGCAKCGECCTDIRILSSPERIVQAATEEEGNEDAVWIMAHWDPNGRSPTGKGWHYTCRRYDPVHQLCTAWDDRPPVCRRFPFYGDKDAMIERGGGPRENRCSYWLDVPADKRPARVDHPLIPLTVITR